MERRFQSDPTDARARHDGDGEPSVRELVRQLVEQTEALARKEVELAKVELSERGKRLGAAAGALGVAGVFALGAFAALTAAVIVLLATAVAAWVAALIVAGGYAAIAGIATIAGRSEVERGTPPVPEEAIASTRADVETVQRRAQEARQ